MLEEQVATGEDSDKTIPLLTKSIECVLEGAFRLYGRDESVLEDRALYAFTPSFGQQPIQRQ
jgi:hypothetical protein